MYLKPSLTVTVTVHRNGITISFRLLDDTDKDVRAAGGAEVDPPLKLKGNKLEAEINTSA